MYSKYFKDSASAVEVFVETLRRALADPDMASALAELKQIVYFDYGQEAAGTSFFLDASRPEILVQTGPPAAAADVTIISSLDVGHQTWSRQLNPLMAVALGRIKTRGSTAALLGLAPILEKIAPIYLEVRADRGLAG